MWINYGCNPRPDHDCDEGDSTPCDEQWDEWNWKRTLPMWFAYCMDCLNSYCCFIKQSLRMILFHIFKCLLIQWLSKASCPQMSICS